MGRGTNRLEARARPLEGGQRGGRVAGGLTGIGAQQKTARHDRALLDLPRQLERFVGPDQRGRDVAALQHALADVDVRRGLGQTPARLPTQRQRLPVVNLAQREVAQDAGDHTQAHEKQNFWRARDRPHPNPLPHAGGRG